MIRKLDPEKLTKLHNTGDLLDRKYGKRGTTTRAIFEEKAFVAYYSEIFKERRKALKMTQQALATQIGKERSYIAHIERGQTDMQLSSFITISNALGMKLSLSPTINIKANDLAVEMTSVNVKTKKLKRANHIETEHINNNLAIQKMLLERGIVPK